MSVIHSRWFVAGLCAALITGCGGGGTTTGCTGANCNGGGNPTTVTFNFSGPNLPTTVAAKIGTGSFSAQTLSGNTLTLSIPSGTSNYAVAYLCPTVAANQYEYVWEANTADGTSWTYTCEYNESQTPPTLTGSLDASAVSGAQSLGIISQNASAVASYDVMSGATANFDVYAPPGSDRVLVLALGSNFQNPLAAKNFDNQTVPGALNGGNPVAFSSADATVPEAITYNNLPSGYGSPGSLVFLVMGGVEHSYLLNATGSYPALPSGATEAQDYYSFVGSAGGTGSNAACNVGAGTSVSGGPVSLPAFPAPWNNCGVPTPAALPTFTINYTGFSGQTNVLLVGSIGWTVGTYQSITVEATANYQSGSTALGTPDLSSIGGFLSPPPSGTQVDWSAGIGQRSYGLTSSLTPLNATWTSVGNSGSFTVP